MSATPSFGQILVRVRQADIPYGSAPWHLEDRQLNDRKGGRGVHFRDPNGLVLEPLTQQ